MQQVVRAAIQGAGRHNVPARAHQGGNGQVQRGLPAGGGDGAYAALQRGDPLLQHRIGGVADAAVHMACALQVEEGLRMFAGLEHKRGAQVDRHGARAGGGVGGGACMECKGVKARVSVTSHRCLQ